MMIHVAAVGVLAIARLNRVTDDQWRDAFRARRYNPEQTTRYVTKLEEKIVQGLALPAG
jgi:hypothetical protein